MKKIVLIAIFSVCFASVTQAGGLIKKVIGNVDAALGWFLLN
jgi:hypothetical protein